MTIKLSNGWLIRAVTSLLCCFAAPACAFVVNSYMDGDETLYLKWGDNHAGSLGRIVTWSFIPSGTPGSAYCGNACPGTSSDSINIENFPGGGFTATPITSLESHIVAMLDRWSAVSGIQFIKIDSDSGVAINDPSAFPPATGQIRIGVFAFSDNGFAGVGYSPPPNGGTGAGDLLINANAYFQFAPGNEGAAFDNTTYAPNDFDSLILHELGHAIGLEHPAYDGNCPVMQVDPVCLGHINRELDPDDIHGVRFLYDTLFANGFD